MNIENYAVRISSVEYLFTTKSDRSATLFDLHLHFNSGGYVRINNLSESEVKPIREAFLASVSDSDKG
jgi:hypothetical protein